MRKEININKFFLPEDIDVYGEHLIYDDGETMVYANLEVDLDSYMVNIYEDRNIQTYNANVCIHDVVIPDELGHNTATEEEIKEVKEIITNLITEEYEEY